MIVGWFCGKISGVSISQTQLLLRDSSPVSSDSVFRPHIRNCFTRPTPEIGQENWTAFVKYLWSNFGLINPLSFVDVCIVKQRRLNILCIFSIH